MHLVNIVTTSFVSTFVYLIFTIFFLIICIESNQVESRTISSKFPSSSDYDLSDDHFSDPYLQMLSDSPSSMLMPHQPLASLKELFQAMITASKVAKKHAERVKMKFVSL